MEGFCSVGGGTISHGTLFMLAFQMLLQWNDSLFSLCFTPSQMVSSVTAPPAHIALVALKLEDQIAQLYSQANSIANIMSAIASTFDVLLSRSVVLVAATQLAKKTSS